MPGLRGILDAEHQVLPHREAGKDIAVLGNVAEPEMRDPVARQARNIAALERIDALRRNLAHDGLDGGGTADTVAAEQADDLAGVDAHIDALQDVALAVIGVQIPDLEHQAASSPR